MEKQTNNWGFNKVSERLNGRIAMIGFLSIILIEVFTKNSILSYL
jgi:Chlorophyll A-B binding protein